MSTTSDSLLDRVGNVFSLGLDKVDPNSLYLRSYPHIAGYFSSKASFDRADFVRGAHMVYGWMPTILKRLGPDQEISACARLLTQARSEGTLDHNQLAKISACINNSLVGASKLLHFAAPNHFFIWDSRVARFIYGKSYRRSSSKKIEIERYQRILTVLHETRKHSRFPEFHASVNSKLGYPVSEIRAIELVMFLNGNQ